MVSLRNILRGVVALVRRKGPRVDGCEPCDALADRARHAVFVGDASTGDVFEFRSDQPVIQRPAAPRPPTVREMTERKP